jgi:hypothetical protein
MNLGIKVNTRRNYQHPESQLASLQTSNQVDFLEVDNSFQYHPYTTVQKGCNSIASCLLYCYFVGVPKVLDFARVRTTKQKKHSSIDT